MSDYSSTLSGRMDIDSAPGWGAAIRVWLLPCLMRRPVSHIEPSRRGRFRTCPYVISRIPRLRATTCKTLLPFAYRSACR